MKRMKELINKYKEVKALRESMEEKYNKIKDKVLSQGNFVDEDTKERITCHNDDYNMSEKQYEVYCQLLYIEQQTEGIYTDNWDVDPMTEYEKKIIQAEDELIIYGINLLNGTTEYYDMINNFNIRSLSHRKKILDILLKYEYKEEKKNNLHSEVVDINKGNKDDKKYTDLINRLDNVKDELLDELETDNFNGDKFYVTLGVRGKNYNIPLCADLYEYMRHLLKEMKEIVGE